MMKANIHLQKISENCYFEGKIHQENRFLSTIEIAGLFCNIRNADDITQILSDINGFFYGVIETEDKIFLITDIVRSYPLFYKIANNEIFIAKNAFDISLGEKLSVKNIDTFLTCDYTLGNKTIFQNIFQVESANLVEISKTDGKTRTAVYHNPVQTPYRNFDKAKLFAKLNETYEKIVGRAINYARGRTIVVPLSGGYDSRLIAITLKRLGAENVICHAYGVEHFGDIGHPEIQTSKQIAGRLGFEWVFVKYSYSEWYKLMHEKNAGNSIKCLSNGVSTIAYQDWLAVAELKKRNLIPQDSVFVPGHTGDFITGSAIPLNVDFSKTYSKMQLIKTLTKQYFHSFSLTQKMQRKICETSLDLPETTYSAEDYIRYIETFSWREYHSKYIANSAQVYNLYGYDWYYPLWDREIVDLWFSVHPQQKIGRKLYKEFAEKYYQSSIPYVSNATTQNLLLKILFKLCRVWKIVFLVDNQYGIASANKFSLFFKKILIPNELKDSFVLNNCNKQLRKISINGIGSLQVLLTVLRRKT